MKKRILLGISIILCLITNIFLFYNRYSHWLDFTWFLSIVLLFFSFWKKPKILINFTLGNLSRLLTIGIIILLPLLTRLVFIDPLRTHTDEFITGYFSAHYDFRTYNFFSAIPQNKVDWQNQFPTPYFALQKIFFIIFGISPYTLKLSTLPYVFIVSLMLYLIIKLLFDMRMAILSVLVYTFLGISVYLETWSLHFISSTAIFLLFFYFVLRYVNERKPYFSVLSGIFAALCYLFYFSSYISLPFLIFIYCILFIKTKNRIIIGHFLSALLAFLITISPFLSYTIAFNNYMPVRFQQVSFNNQVKDTKQEPLLILQSNLKNSLQSFYKDRLGGCGGYDFGHLAFFDKTTLSFFILGLILSFIYLHKKWQLSLILLTIFVTFLGAMVLTTPPPPYHRFSISYPFISFLIAFPLYIILIIPRFNLFIRYSMVLLLLFILAFINISYFQKALAIDKESRPEETGRIAIISYVEKYYPNRKIYFASFPSYAFEKVYYFFNPKRIFITNYHNNLIKTFNKNEKYVYVIIFPEVFNNQFQALDSSGILITNLSPNYSLFTN